MPIFEVKYSFDIRDNLTEELSYWERGTFEVEASDKNNVNTDAIRIKIKELAREHCTKTHEVISYANYYSIKEV